MGTYSSDISLNVIVLARRQTEKRFLSLEHCLFHCLTTYGTKVKALKLCAHLSHSSQCSQSSGILIDTKCDKDLFT